VNQLIQQGVAESDIAVLSQYRAQHKELQTVLQQQQPGVTVSTVAAAQGRLRYPASCDAAVIRNASAKL